jgi:hypothetical protein
MCVKKAPDFKLFCWGYYNADPQTGRGQPYPKPYADNTNTIVTGIQSLLGGSYYYGYLSYVDGNGLLTSNGSNSGEQVPCTMLTSPDGGPL